MRNCFFYFILDDWHICVQTERQNIENWQSYGIRIVDRVV